MDGPVTRKSLPATCGCVPVRYRCCSQRIAGATPAARSKIHLFLEPLRPEDKDNWIASRFRHGHVDIFSQKKALRHGRPFHTRVFPTLGGKQRCRRESGLSRLIGQLDSLIEQAHVPLFQWLQPGHVVHVEGIIPGGQAQAEAREADYLLLIDITERNSGYTVPAKLFEYIRGGQPVSPMPTKVSDRQHTSKAGIPYQLLYRGEGEECMDEKIMVSFPIPSDPTPQSQSFLDQFDHRGQTATLARLLDRLHPKNGGRHAT